MYTYFVDICSGMSDLISAKSQALKIRFSITFPLRVCISVGPSVISTPVPISVFCPTAGIIFKETYSRGRGIEKKDRVSRIHRYI